MIKHDFNTRPLIKPINEGQYSKTCYFQNVEKGHFLAKGVQLHIFFINLNNNSNVVNFLYRYR